jgi:hypothetical protein
MEQKRDYITILSVIISTATILIAIGTAWGEVHAEVSALRESQVKIEARMQILESVVRTHHDDTDRHVDGSWKKNIVDSLIRIENKVDAHMRDSIRRDR